MFFYNGFLEESTATAYAGDRTATWEQSLTTASKNGNPFYTNQSVGHGLALTGASVNRREAEHRQRRGWKLHPSNIGSTLLP